jgi:RimJ/RimL family protein N-acetyltransferase
MAGFTDTSLDRASFDARWVKLRSNPSVTTKVIEVGGDVVGHIASWDQSGKRAVTYWIGREFWGRGIATEALASFLSIEKARPLHAMVASDNVGSLRVLTKCGFQVVGQARAFAHARGEEVDELALQLEA